MKRLLTCLLLGMFSVALVAGCQASAEVDDTDGDGDSSKTTKTTVDRDDDGSKTTKTETTIKQ
jgi:hypothetical protein